MGEWLRCPITGDQLPEVVIGHPCDRVPNTWQIGARRTNHDREICYRYDLWWLKTASISFQD